MILNDYRGKPTYYKDVNAFNSGVRKAMDKGRKQGAAESNKHMKLERKNEQRKRDLAKKITNHKKPERGHEERLHKRMMAEGDRSENDYR